MLRRASAPDGIRTANFDSQFQEMFAAWNPIFNRFAEGPPDVPTFLAQFGPHIWHSLMQCKRFSGAMLREAVVKSDLSAPGLDGWSVAALKSLANCSPELFDKLALLLGLVEDSGIWPQAFVTASVSLIPKDASQTAPLPTDLRPLTILSSIYRVWAKARLPALVEWQEQWLPDQAWGFRPGRSAEGLFFCTSFLDMECAAAAGDVAAGISFDLRKAFDHIPTDLLLTVLEARGCHPCILRPLRGLFDQMLPRFRLRGTLGPAFSSSNGIPQGCPLSPICLNAVLGVWLEAMGSLLPAVLLGITVPGLRDHSPDLRLVGGSIVAIDGELCPRPAVISGLLPFPVFVFCLSWQQRCRILQSTVTQAVWGHGTHPGNWSKDSLRTLRTQVLASLWQSDHWLASPLRVLTVLASPAIDPSFAFPYQCICTLGRLLGMPSVLHQARRFFSWVRGPACGG